MNEIIKALFIQAGGSVEEENGNLWTYSDDLDPELFAQLVVRECAEMVRKNNYQFMSNEQHYGVTSGDILNHFGIAKSNIAAAEHLHSDKGYSIGTPEAQEAFDSKRGYKL